MTIHLDKVILLGRCLDEYRLMFNLTEQDLTKNIVSIADGPASTNAELSGTGVQFTSVDPIYDLPPEEIEASFYESFDDVFEKVDKDAFLKTRQWIYFKDSKHMKSHTAEVFERFIADYRKRAGTNAYVPGRFPELPLENETYDIALCSFLLFCYTNVLSYEFHLNAIKEMMRVADEARIHPLLDLSFQTSEYVEPIVADLTSAGFDVRIEPVVYQPIDTDNHVMVVKRA